MSKDGSLVPLGHEYDAFASSRATGTGRIGPRRAQHKPQATCGHNEKPSPVLAKKAVEGVMLNMDME